MILYEFARKVNKRIKVLKKKKAGKYLSAVRRIEFVCPPVGRRVCAMTFDDGPCALPPNPSHTQEGLTEVIVSTLEKYGARGTFDIIGTTAQNYPDVEGELNDFSWSGVHYDHYPKFGQDDLAGAVNQPQLIQRLLDGGHELANHGYTHRLFGPMNAVYKGRHHFTTLVEVTGDLKNLDDFIMERFGYQMKLSRPPHYIDAIPQGGTSYDAYRYMGYNYLAASFDGGGWMPSCGDYQKDVENMISPLRETLEKDPESLNGKIIFQKDGCNMTLQTPIADALGPQLALLKEYGYEVVTVSELLKMSPFEDIHDGCAEYPYIMELLGKNHIVGYKNNTFQGEKDITVDEFAVMLTNSTFYRVDRPLSYQDMVSIARSNCGIDLPKTKYLCGDFLLEITQKYNIPCDKEIYCGVPRIQRKVAVEFIAKLVESLR